MILRERVEVPAVHARSGSTLQFAVTAQPEEIVPGDRVRLTGQGIVCTFTPETGETCGPAALDPATPILVTAWPPANPDPDEGPPYSGIVGVLSDTSEVTVGVGQTLRTSYGALAAGEIRFQFLGGPRDPNRPRPRWMDFEVSDLAETAYGDASVDLDWWTPTLVALPDTLAPGDEATLSLSGDGLYSEATVTLTLSDGAPGTLAGLCAPPAAKGDETSARAGAVTVQTTVSAFSDCRFVAGEEAGTATLTAEMVGLTLAATVTVEGAVVVELVNAEGDVATHLKIAKWEQAFDLTLVDQDGSVSVLNETFSERNFVDLDPDHFAVRITSAEDNIDAEVAETIVAHIGTDSDEDSAITLIETGLNTGVFSSIPQLLTVRDFLIANQDPDGIRTTDDGFRATTTFEVLFGENVPVADEAIDDRTHKTRVGGVVRVRFGDETAEAIVCDEIKTVRYTNVVLLEPYQDNGIPGAPLNPDGTPYGAGNFQFDEVDLNGDGQIGLWESEPYFDFSAYEGSLRNPWNVLTTIRGQATGRGPVVSDAFIAQNDERTVLSYEQGCVVMTPDPSPVFLDLPGALHRYTASGSIDFALLISPGGDIVLSQAAFQTELLAFVAEAISPGSLGIVHGFGIDTDRYNAGPGSGRTAGYAATLLDVYGVSDRDIAFVDPLIPASRRTVAHELGHLLTRLEDPSRSEPISPRP